MHSDCGFIEHHGCMFSQTESHFAPVPNHVALRRRLVVIVRRIEFRASDRYLGCVGLMALASDFVSAIWPVISAGRRLFQGLA
jgi:hypothetical protein